MYLSIFFESATSIKLDFEVLRVNLFFTNQCAILFKSKFNLNCKSPKEEEEKDSAASSANKAIDVWDRDLISLIRDLKWILGAHRQPFVECQKENNPLQSFSNKTLNVNETSLRLVRILQQP